MEVQVLACMHVLFVVVGFGLQHHVEWQLEFWQLHFFLFGRKLERWKEARCR